MKFSVTIPTYKPYYLKECINSVLTQSYTDFELIIVNDNSPFDIDSIINSFSDNRIRYYKNTIGFGTEKVVQNWNKCLNYALGDFIICMGDDDKLLPNFLKDLAVLIDQHTKLDIFYSHTQLIDENSKVIKTFPLRPERESIYEMIWRRWNGGQMCIGDYCYRTSALKEKGGFYYLPFAWGSDAISAYEAAKNMGIANTSKPGFQYRVNSHSISSKSDNIEGKIQALKEERKWFEDFFKREAPTSKDQILLAQLRKMMHPHFVHMLSGDIIYGVGKHPIQGMKYWTTHREEVGLSMWELTKCFIHGIVGR